MMRLNTEVSKNKKFIILAVCLITAFAIVNIHSHGEEAVAYTVTDVESVTIEQTITAAGELKAAASEDIDFSTTKTFKGMCVEEGDVVRKNQHLIEYTDGTYTDAPDDGIVTEINMPGVGTCAGESNVITLAYTDKMLLEISVPEDEIDKLAKGDEAEVIVNANAEKTFNGKVTSVKAMPSEMLSEDKVLSEDKDEGRNNSVTGDTVYYSATILLTNDGTLRPGMSANCTIQTSPSKSVLAVPVEAVSFDENDEPYVNIVSGDDTEKRAVTTGRSDAFYVEIKDGLSKGDTVQIESRR